MKLSETRALLTGASGGIGQPLAGQLCAAGAKLIVAGRDAESLAAIASRHPGQVTVVPADLRRREGRDAVEDAVRRAGGVNCLINAAGINRFTMLEQQDEESIADVLDLNVTANLQLTHRLLPMLRREPTALVVNVGSTFGSIGYPGFAAYCASKFAVRGFSEALRRELADTRVKVLYIAPRATKTAMNAAPVVAMNRQLNVAMDDPAFVASRIVEAIGREREELYFGWPEKLFVKLNGLLPRLVDQALRKQLPTIQHFARTDIPEKTA